MSDAATILRTRLRRVFTTEDGSSDAADGGGYFWTRAIRNKRYGGMARVGGPYPQQLADPCAFPRNRVGLATIATLRQESTPNRIQMGCACLLADGETSRAARPPRRVRPAAAPAGAL